MSIVDKPVMLMLSALLLAASPTHARDRAHRECIVDAVQWGHISRQPLASSGLLESFDRFSISADNGDVDVAFAVFELPRFKDQVIFGKLRLEVDIAYSAEFEQPRELQLIMYDVADTSLLLQPYWTIEEYLAVLSDLESGREYGEFTVRTSLADSGRVDDGRVLEVPLSYEAMFDINEARNGSIAIGIAHGDGWYEEAEFVQFLSPTNGGMIQLVLPNCKSHQRR